jgi:hypothetical protein
LICTLELRTGRNKILIDRIFRHSFLVKGVKGKGVKNIIYVPSRLFLSRKGTHRRKEKVEESPLTPFNKGGIKMLYLTPVS